MKIEQNYNLSKLNTFGIDVNAKFFVEIKNENDLTELFVLPEFKNNQKIFLGGGSNVLFTKDFDGMVVLNKSKGTNVTEVGENDIYVHARGGEIWHDLVIFAVDHGYWGIENLALIPGTVGAAPVQNIGAYGTELKDVLESVEVFDIETGEKRILNKEECELGYRESVFKNKLKGKCFISTVTLKLSKAPKPNLSYKILSDFLEKPADVKALAGKNKIASYSLKDIFDAVIAIRRSKLPDPKITGNVGSFFKNVFVSKEQLENLLKIYPELPYFEEGGVVKIPAGWLIEQCGWKGKRIGNVGVHKKQALFLVNYGGAAGSEIVELANKISTSVQKKFGLGLTPEVNII